MEKYKQYIDNPDYEFVSNGNKEVAANVEGGETMHDDGIDKYIFSDRLVVDPKSKITFADASKKINNKYKGTLDKVQKESRELELNRLKQEQEIFKSTIAGTQNNQQSQIPMFSDGGGLKRMYEDPNLGNDFNLDWSPNDIPYVNQNQNMINRSSIENVYTPADLPSKFEQFTPLSPEELDRRQAESLFNTSGQVYFDPADNIAAPEENYTIYDEKTGNPITLSNSKESNKQKSGLPQDKINPLGFAASNMGNVYDLFQASKPAEVNKFDKVSLDRINLESQRRELEKQAGQSSALNRESARNLASSSGQALGNQIVGNALINSSLSSGLSESFLNEANANTGIKNQEEMTNNQIRQAEIIADQMDKAKRQSTTSQALHSVGMNTQGYVRDLKSAEVGNKNNELWFDAIKTGKYTQMGFDSQGNAVIQLHDGRVITKPKTN